jgi:hypothetical protein
VKKSSVEKLFGVEDTLVTVTMDADVYRWLQEMVEAKHRAQRYTGWIPDYQDMVDRAAESFRAAGEKPPEVVPEVVSNGKAPPKRVIHRRVAKKR